MSDIARDEKGDTSDLLEEDLIPLMVLVLYTREEDILVRIRCHTRGSGGCFMRFLHKVAWAIPCYSEHHHDD